jgi:hypothetical protein
LGGRRPEPEPEPEPGRGRREGDGEADEGPFARKGRRRAIDFLSIPARREPGHPGAQDQARKRSKSPIHRTGLPVLMPVPRTSKSGFIFKLGVGSGFMDSGRINWFDVLTTPLRSYS